MSEDKIKAIDKKIDDTFKEIQEKQKEYHDLRISAVTLKNKDNSKHIGKCFKKGGQFVRIIGLNVDGSLRTKALRFSDGGYDFTLGELDTYGFSEQSFKFFSEYDCVEITEQEFFEEIQKHIAKALFKDFETTGIEGI